MSRHRHHPQFGRHTSPRHTITGGGGRRGGRLPRLVAGRLQGRAAAVLVVCLGLVAGPTVGSTASPPPEGTTVSDVADLIGARSLWSAGHTGEGVGIALIDSGVVPVPGIAVDVVHGPDLSLEALDPALHHLDTYGHGTHLAGIAAGRDADWSPPGRVPGVFAGIAPGATLVNVKVASGNGFADVTQVIAAIDWVVQHRKRHNIRVLVLAYGTDGVQDYQLDPLTHAVEVAWNNGIVVVAAAGNAGFGDGRMDNPAYDPFVLAVGAADPRGTRNTADDVVPEWSSRGDGERNPDVVAPGVSLVSLRNPGSHIDRRHPEAREGDRFFRGSGTSQAAAVVAGGAALLLDHRPDLQPDQVKDLLMSTASPLGDADPVGQGAGMIALDRAAGTTARPAAQDHRPAAGVGLVDTARGSVLGSLLFPLLGEVDAGGVLWNGVIWSQRAIAGTTWRGGGWTGRTWTGGEWRQGRLHGNSWSGNSWSGNSWSGNSWSGTWTGNSWSGAGWTGNAWSDAAWSTAGWQ